MNPSYDPDWPSPDELRSAKPRYTRADAMRDLLLVAVCYAFLAWASCCAGCAAPGELPPGAIDFVTNAAQRLVVADPIAPTNEWWRTFPETEKEYLELCEPKIQEKLLDYPEEEREHMRELLRSEESTAYLFKSIYAELMREAFREQTQDPATGSPGAEAGVSSGVAGSASSSTEEHVEDGGENPGSPSSSYSPVLDFRYGGVKGRPVEDSRCRISKLKIGSDSLSIHWDTGIPSDWKRGDTKKGPMILACAFYESDGRWIGGKFDWIDEHRSSRSLENIHGGYGGWNAGAWNAAKRRAFCVMSFDGKYRSNLLED